MAHKVLKPFNTVTRRFNIGDAVTEADTPIFDALMDRGFITKRSTLPNPDTGPVPVQDVVIEPVPDQSPQPIPDPDPDTPAPVPPRRKSA